MKLQVLAGVALLAVAAGASAQRYDPNRDSGVVESTDPARIAEVERRAEEIRARQERTTTGASGTSSDRQRPVRRTDRG